MRHDLHSLQLFIAVAECGNLTRAAEREHLAVSAVSKRMAELEAQVRTPLLQRLPRGVALTPAGQSLLRHARTLLRVIGDMDSELSDYAGGIKGHVKLHAVASALTQFLPTEIESFLAQYPEVRISLEEQTSKTIVRAVSEGVADLGVISGYTPSQGLLTLPYQRDRLVAGVPLRHPLARRQSLRFKALLAHAFVGPQADSSLAALLGEAAQREGLAIRQRVQASSFEVMCRLVEAGLGVTVLPQGSIERSVAAGRLCAVPLDEPWADRELVIVVRDLDETGHITRTLIDHLQRAGAQARPGD